MQITRSDFLRDLSAVKPGLASEPIAPITGYVWFTGTHMMTYNDVIAISVPFKTDFEGAVPGPLLINTLESSFARNATLEARQTYAKLKAGKTDLDLPLLLPDAFLFKMPKLVDGIRVKNDHGIFQVLSDCQLSVGKDFTDANQLGVTLIQEDSALYGFSTNRTTLCRSRISGNPGFLEVVKRVLIPTSFCEQVLAMRSDKEPMLLWFGKTYALFKSGSVTLWGRYIRNDKPYNYLQIIDRYVPKNANGNMRPTPKDFKGIVGRALFVAEDAKTQRTVISIQDGKAKMVTKSERGAMQDAFDLDHDDVSITIVPKHLKSVADKFDKILVTKASLILSNGKTVFVVSSIEER